MRLKKRKKMVAQPSIAQGGRFSIQYFICILNLVMTEVPGYNILYSSDL